MVSKNAPEKIRQAIHEGETQDLDQDMGNRIQRSTLRIFIVNSTRRALNFELVSHKEDQPCMYHA
jgi:hypothetical protein